MHGRDIRLGVEAERQWGAFTRAQALDAGWSYRAIDRNVASGRWLRLHPDVFCDATHPRSRETLAMAAVLAAGQNAPLAALSHASALAAHGLLKEWPPRRVDVLVPHGHSPELDGVRLHRSRDLAACDVIEWHGIPTATVERALIDTTRLLAPSIHMLCLDEAIRLGLCSISALGARATELRRPGRSGPAAVLEALGTRPHDAEAMDSTLEILLARQLGPRAWVHHHRVTVPGTGRSWEADFALPELKVSVEADGAQHDGFGQSERDRLRDMDLADLGWVQVRLSWQDITLHPDAALRRIHEAVRLGAQKDAKRRLGALAAP